MARVEAIRWDGEHLWLLDQRVLPTSTRWVQIHSVDEAIAAIRDLVVRGAPAIGITAAYAAVLAAVEHAGDRAAWEADLERLAQARPTAVNLHWAVERMRRVPDASQLPGDALTRLRDEAERIHREDIEANRAMAAAGSALIETDSRVLTHCNTGSLATGGVGTALGVIVEAWNRGLLSQVYACETRPWLQGLRLTAWELDQEGVSCDVLVEGAAAGLLRSGGVDWVITGADRICANGDTANKVGTLMLAVLARHFGARMMVVAPSSSFDMALADGDAIRIEHRSGEEIWQSAGIRTPPDRAGSFNPVFDVTPGELIDVIVTERGVARPPFARSLQSLLGSG
ncbi:MAG: S-methyl-5-thioribose-1-phosphate isomerase [Wenzhouxiangellaceae bacterium]